MFFSKHFGPSRDQEERGDSEQADVRRNLEWILTSVRGVTSFLPTLGLSDNVHRPSSGVVAQLRAEVIENIERYEPRLEILAVEEEWDEDAERPRIQIDARLRSSDERLRLSVDTLSRKLSVSSDSTDEK
jgi:type VI secretion system lysozyme-like protein